MNCDHDFVSQPDGSFACWKCGAVGVAAIGTKQNAALDLGLGEFTFERSEPKPPSMFARFKGFLAGLLLFFWCIAIVLAGFSIACVAWVATLLFHRFSPSEHPTKQQGAAHEAAQSGYTKSGEPADGAGISPKADDQNQDGRGIF